VVPRRDLSRTRVGDEHRERPSACVAHGVERPAFLGVEVVLRHWELRAVGVGLAFLWGVFQMS